MRPGLLRTLAAALLAGSVLAGAASYLGSAGLDAAGAFVLQQTGLIAARAEQVRGAIKRLNDEQATAGKGASLCSRDSSDPTTPLAN